MKKKWWKKREDCVKQMSCADGYVWNWLHCDCVKRLPWWKTDPIGGQTDIEPQIQGKWSKSRTDTAADDLRKRRKLHSDYPLPDSISCNGKITTLHSCKGYSPPNNTSHYPNNSYAFLNTIQIRSLPTYGSILNPTPINGGVPLPSAPAANPNPWNPTYAGLIGCNGFTPAGINITVNGQDPVSGEWVDIGSTVQMEECATGVVTTITVPANSTGAYWVGPVFDHDPAGCLAQTVQYPAPTHVLHLNRHSTSPYSPCDCGGRGIIAKLCQPGPGNPNPQGTIVYGYDPAGSLTGNPPLTEFWRGFERVTISPTPGSTGSPYYTMLGTDPVVGQFFNVDNTFYEEQCSPPGFGVPYGGNQGGGMGHNLNGPITIQAKYRGVWEVIAVNPNTTPLMDSINPNGTALPGGAHLVLSFNPITLTTGSILGSVMRSIFEIVPTTPACYSVPTPCDAPLWAATPWAYSTMWFHLQNMTYNPPILMPNGTLNNGSGITPGTLLYNPLANINFANQFTLCEWCADWQNTGSIPGTFDQRVLNWGAPWTISFAEQQCQCCPTTATPIEVPPPTGTLDP